MLFCVDISFAVMGRTCPTLEASHEMAVTFVAVINKWVRERVGGEDEDNDWVRGGLRHPAVLVDLDFNLSTLSHELN